MFRFVSLVLVASIVAPALGVAQEGHWRGKAAGPGNLVEDVTIAKDGPAKFKIVGKILKGDRVVGKYASSSWLRNSVLQCGKLDVVPPGWEGTNIVTLTPAADGSTLKVMRFVGQKPIVETLPKFEKASKASVDEGLGEAMVFVAAQGAKDKVEEKPAQKTILFLGDSITAGGGYVRTIQAELDKQSPKAWAVVNRGRSSETLSNLSEVDHPGRRPCLFARLDDELKKAKPDWVVACYGINCGIYHPYNEKRFAAYQEGVETLVKKVHGAGAKLILLTSPPFAASGPFPEGSDEAAKAAIIAKANAAAEIEAEANPRKFGYKSPFPYYDDVMAKYAKWLLTLNGRKDVWVVDVRGAMLPKNKEAHGRDPIHPNGVGHAIMAEAFMKQWPAIQAQVAGK